MKMPIRIIIVVIWCCAGVQSARAFVHPGCLSTQADLDRMAAKVAAGEEPWKSGYDRLAANVHAQSGYVAYPHPTPCRGSWCSQNGYVEDYITMARDAAAAYQCALRYRITGDTAYADAAMNNMDGYAATVQYITGGTDALLLLGAQGFQFACAAELLRDYEPWVSSGGFAGFQTFLLEKFYIYPPTGNGLHHFLVAHNGTCDSHYWANWDLFAMSAVLAIGVVCDRQDIYDEAVAYYLNGVGNGAADKVTWFRHPGNLAQSQESGRDQGHCTLNPVLLGMFCEVAWNQGDDLYGYADNALLALSEYVCKYNLWNTVPYITYFNCDNVVQVNIAGASRGAVRPGYDLIYNHYVNRRGLAAPYTMQMALAGRPEGGGGDYGETSGGYDQQGFTTLTHALDPIASGAAPSGLWTFVKGRQITLSWTGSARAGSYNIKRSTTGGGPYTTVAVADSEDTYYLDGGLMANTTYYYVVSANHSDGEGADSDPVAATTDDQYLWGTVIGTDGAYLWGMWKENVFDGSMQTYFDGPTGLSWTGLDLGPGASAVVTKVKYCPRPGFSGRMVGGAFQGSDTADFSSGVVTLFTINSGPPEGVFASQTISNPNAFRYVRYISPADGWGNASEIQFLGRVSGSSAPAAPSGLNAAVVGNDRIDVTWDAVPGATSYNLKRAATSGGPYVIKNLMDTSHSDTGLADSTTYYYAVCAVNIHGQSIPSAEVSAATPVAPLTGTIIGTNGSWGDDPARTKRAAMDGNMNTFYDAVNGTGDWVGLDFGSGAAHVITDIRYVPRAGYSGRMVGGRFQGAATADFSSGLADLFTVTDPPAEGDYTTRTISDPTAYRYVRYLSAPNGYCNVAEVEFYRQHPPATPRVLAARYTFDGHADDGTGNYPATAMGSPTYTTGKIDQAVDLDGTEDYLRLPAHVADSADMTVAAWINWDGGDPWQRIFDFGNDTNQYMFLSPRSGGDTLRFAITTAGYGAEQVVETTPLSTGAWTHVAVTLEANVGRLYVNGSLKDTNTGMTLNPSDFDPAWNYLGYSQFSSDPPFDGRIDDARVYNYALSDLDIWTLSLGKANQPPYFTVSPIANTGAVEDAPYTGGCLAEYAVDLDGDPLEFGRSGGPAWLNVDADGLPWGTPSDSDVGRNVFEVSVTDPGGLGNVADMNIDVANIYSGVRGVADLEGLTAQWLRSGCVDTPACGGADLDGDQDVDVHDFAILANRWLTP